MGKQFLSVDTTGPVLRVSSELKCEQKSED